MFLGTACILSLNWGTYIWAVNNGYIVEASLGYFINPLVTVLLGVIILKERLRLWQWLSIGIAALGVLYLTVSYGQFPWIALTLAFTFGFYGLLRKTAPLDSIGIRRYRFFRPCRVRNKHSTDLYWRDDFISTTPICISGAQNSPHQDGTLTLHYPFLAVFIGRFRVQ